MKQIFVNLEAWFFNKVINYDILEGKELLCIQLHIQKETEKAYSCMIQLIFTDLSQSERDNRGYWIPKSVIQDFDMEKYLNQ